MSKRLNVGSLFAGIGGFCLGFQKSEYESNGYKVVWGNEIDKEASRTYRSNFNHILLEGDVNLVLHPDNAGEEKDYYEELQSLMLSEKLDLLNGGFPCQAFSIAGERKGFEDERGNLFWSIIGTVKLHEKKFGEKPRVLLLENVKNLKSHDHGRTYDVIKSEIEKLGYIVKEAVLNTMDYTSLPQTRERIYIACFRDVSDAEKFTMFDNLKDYKTTKTKSEWTENFKAIIDIYSKVHDKYYYTKEKYPNYFITQEQYEKIPVSDRRETRINLDEEITEFYQFYQIRRGMYIRKNKSNVCPTLTANMGTGGHNVPLIKDNFGIRKLTPQETLKLQGFPTDKGYNTPCTDSMLYKQAGNAVSVPVVKLVADELLKILSS